MDNIVQNNRIGTCITYLTDSDAIKNSWYWPDTIQIPGIGAALELVLEYMELGRWKILVIGQVNIC